MSIEPFKIVMFPDKKLSQVSVHVDDIDHSIRDILDRLLLTTQAYEGLGIAAVQVGILKRIVVINMNDNKRYEHVADGENKPLFMVNPVITEFSSEKTELSEGCLSIPGIRINVTRPSHIRVEYLDYDNNKQSLSADGLLAKCIQHEVDHLNGKLILDYLSPLKRGMQIKKMEKYLKLNSNT